MLLALDMYNFFCDPPTLSKCVLMSPLMMYLPSLVEALDLHSRSAAWGGGRRVRGAAAGEAVGA